MNNVLQQSINRIKTQFIQIRCGQFKKDNEETDDSISNSTTTNKLHGGQHNRPNGRI